MQIDQKFADIDGDFKIIEESFYEAIREVYPDIESTDLEIKIERPADSSHGDWACNAAMSLSRAVGKSPRDIATELLDSDSIKSLQSSELIQDISIAGPGFINITYSQAFISTVAEQIMEQGDDYGKLNVGVGKKVMIEFGQPNTHKAFHVGHLKSAISGFGLVKLYTAAGFEVITANFFGDVGMHVAKCTWGYLNSSELQSLDLDAMDSSERMVVIDSAYVYGAKMFKEDPESESAIREVNKLIYTATESAEYEAYRLLREYSLDHQNEVWDSLGVSFAREYPESEVFEDAVKIVEDNKELFKDDGGAVIFDASDNDDKKGLNNWVFITQEGLPTYEAKDLALAKLKFTEYNPDYSIITTSVEQSARFRSIIYLLEQIDPAFKDRYLHIPFGWMLRSGKKFSSRMGESVKGLDVLEEVRNESLKKIEKISNYAEEEKHEIASKVAQAGLKFLILSHEFHKDFSYNPDEFLDFEGFSGPSCLYAYARAKSILRKESGNYERLLSDADFRGATIANLDEAHIKKDGVALLKLLSQLDLETFAALQNISPHILANYAYSVAQAFNSYYGRYTVLKSESDDIKHARLLLVTTTSQVLKNALSRIGIEVVERM